MGSITLDMLADALRMLDPADRLEVLVEYGSRLPPLDPAWHPARDAGLHLIHECQAPVFFFVERLATRVVIHADVPAEAPVARGFVGLLYEIFNGCSIAELRGAPADLLASLGLTEALGMRRIRGLTAIYLRLRAASDGA